MKKLLIFIFIFLISSPILAGQITMAPNIIQSSDCSFLTWMGTLCHDTDDGKLYKWNGTALEEIQSGIALDTIWDAAGDLVQGTGANTAAKLPAGAVGKVLRSAGAGIGVGWSDYTIATPTTGGLLYGSSASAWANLAAGTEGQILRAGASPFLPAWTSTLTGVSVDFGSPAAANYPVTMDANGVGQVGTDMVVPGTLSVTGHPTFEGVTATGATGTGKIVFDTSPTLVTPTLGVATATSLTIANVTNDNYLQITDNAGGRAPTGSAWELYPDAGVWKMNTNGTESTIAKLEAPTFVTSVGLPATLTSAAALTWTLMDNQASGLSFGATGATDILKIGTLDTGPIVTVTGDLVYTGTVTGPSANDPFVYLNETDGTDWWIGLDDTGNELEFRQSATVGTSVKIGFPDAGGINLYGSTSGTTTLNPSAVAGTTTLTIPAITGRVQVASAGSVITPSATASLAVGLSNFYTWTVTDDEDSTLTFSGAGSAGEEVTIIFTTAGTADEIITFHATLVSSTGTLTLGTTAGKFYTIRFISDGSHWYEVSRTAVQT